MLEAYLSFLRVLQYILHHIVSYHITASQITLWEPKSEFLLHSLVGPSLSSDLTASEAPGWGPEPASVLSNKGPLLLSALCNAHNFLFLINT